MSKELSTVDDNQPVKMKVLAEGLNAFELQFCHEYIQNECVGSRAYLKLKPHVLKTTAIVEASKMLASPSVKKYLHALVTADIDESMILRKMRELAYNAESESVRLKALSNLSEIIGMKTKTKTTTENGGVNLSVNFNIPEKKAIEAKTVDAKVSDV